MNRFRVWGTAIATVAVLALPFVGGGGPGPDQSAAASTGEVPRAAQHRAYPVADAAGIRSGTLDRRAAHDLSGTACPVRTSGSIADQAPATVSALGVGGTTQADLVSFAEAFNTIRIANCLDPIPFDRFTWDSCMEKRLVWMAEDPSTDPQSAWGHLGSVRSDGVPSVGCDGNLAGGSDNTGATVASKWWESDKHRASLYRPDSDITGACIAFAMTHGGVPNEDSSFTRAAARWYTCA
ncbi:MAG: hypothetical protein J0J03_13570 [Leifsonia sp.]|nr:hypothetical protein [Leifsonia sp.]